MRHPYSVWEGTTQDVSNRREGALGATLETTFNHTAVDAMEEHKGTPEKSFLALSIFTYA